MRGRTKKLDRHLFLETSAQILRLAGDVEIRDDINLLIKTSKKVGTSWFVKQEFEHVYVRLYDLVSIAASELADPHRPRPFPELLEEIREHLPTYLPGGRNLFHSLSVKLLAKHAQDLVTPTLIRNSFSGNRETLIRQFFSGEMFDESSCCVWKHHGLSACDRTPAPHCKLKNTCIDLKESFVAAVKTIAFAHKQESQRLKDHLDSLENAHGLDLMKILGRHPNDFGDVIIYMEVPEGWTILTRDTAFETLSQTDIKNLRLFKVRAVRRPSGRKCKIKNLSRAGKETTAFLIDYNSKGVRIRADKLAGKKGDRISLKAPEFGILKEGVIAYAETSDPRVYGIRLPFKARTAQ
jgi:hypothetical protein